MKFSPLHDRVLVKRKIEEEKKGSLFIPDTFKEKPQQGIVVAVGLGAKDKNGARIQLDVNLDDLILFGKYAGQEIKIDGEELLILREEEILGVLS